MATRTVSQASRRLNKKMILIDAYPEGAYTFQNVGIDDYSGGYQDWENTLYSCGYKKALLLRKRRVDSDTIGGWIQTGDGKIGGILQSLPI